MKQAVNIILSALLLLSISANAFLLLENGRIAQSNGAISPSSSSGSQTQNSISNGNFLLLGELKEQKVKLYSVKPYGAIIEIDGVDYYRDWQSIGDNTQSVTMNMSDYNVDNKQEIAVISSVKDAESGLVIDQLHMVMLNDVGSQKKKITDSTFTFSQVSAKLAPLLNVKQSKDLSTTTVVFNNQEYISATSTFNGQLGNVVGLVTDSDIEFYFDKLDIYVRIGVSAVYSQSQKPIAVGDIISKVYFYDNKFVLSGYFYTPLS